MAAVRIVGNPPLWRHLSEDTSNHVVRFSVDARTMDLCERRREFEEADGLISYRLIFSSGRPECWEVV